MLITAAVEVENWSWNVATSSSLVRRCFALRTQLRRTPSGCLGVPQHGRVITSSFGVVSQMSPQRAVDANHPAVGHDHVAFDTLPWGW